MPHVIIKKTFKIKPAGFKVAAEKNFSLHGSGVTTTMVNSLNLALQNIRHHGKAAPIAFQPNGNNGHYTAVMNHDYQKYNEEDAVCAILDTMEILGWSFRFQYDQEVHSEKMNGASFTKRELFIFHQAR